MRWLLSGALAMGTLGPPPAYAAGEHLAPEIRAALVAEAAERFAIPAPWIVAVMRAESANDPRARSLAGALGLMQIMPDTYAELRTRYGLGADPYHPRDNIMAGAAYLRELHAQFGAPGFLAAHNAGPGRYLQYLAGTRPLPQETRDYVAILAPQVQAAVPPHELRLDLAPRSLFANLDGPAADGAPAGSSLFVAVSNGANAP